MAVQCTQLKITQVSSIKEIPIDKSSFPRGCWCPCLFYHHCKNQTQKRYVYLIGSLREASSHNIIFLNSEFWYYGPQRYNFKKTNPTSQRSSKREKFEHSQWLICNVIWRAKLTEFYKRACSSNKLITNYRLRKCITRNT